MWLLIGVCASVLVLGLIGHTYPRLNNYPSPSSYQPLPDLRISEFAPDFFLALDTARVYVDKEPERKAKKTEDKLTEIRNRRMKHDEAMYKHYYDQVQEIKTRRWREGNPVTKKNPIDPDEMPPAPYYQSYRRVV